MLRGAHFNPGSASSTRALSFEGDDDDTSTEDSSLSEDALFEETVADDEDEDEASRTLSGRLFALFLFRTFDEVVANRLPSSQGGSVSAPPNREKSLHDISLSLFRR